MLKVLDHQSRHHSITNFLSQDQNQTLKQPQNSREQIKEILRKGIRSSLDLAQTLSPEESVAMIREKLSELQSFCHSVGKNFIFVEEAIDCNQYDLGGTNHESATLFRGPDQRATVAICITKKGSLLYRNDSVWEIYCNAGDIAPVI